MRESSLLIVSASTGTGHLRAAEALRQAAAEAGVKSEHVDLLELAPAWVRSVYGAGYEAVAMHAPRVWKGIYRLTDGDADRARWAPLARRILFREFDRLLRSRPWHACVCTHFLPCQLAADFPGLPPFSLVMTDLTVHRYWVQPRVRRYFVAVETAAADLRRRVPGARVQATGIPVSAAIAAVPDRDAARAALGLADGPLLLVTGGGLGIGVEEAADAALAGAPAKVRVVAVCGKNEAARERLAARAAGEPRLRVLGYVRNLEEWMAAADVVAGKPGGLFTSEALALGKPLVLTRPIPGAEDGNLRVVTDEGAALAGRGFAEMRDAFARVFTEPAVMSRLASNARRLGRPDAARAVIAAVTAREAVERAA
ncbi:MAG TPA: glycosyltransferase [Longimicrobium sp.]|nr:glycosyltransferase [Longimicrobium sp.]